MTTLDAAATGFYTALNSLLGGDAGPMFDAWSHADDVTYMSPFGELLTGWDAVRQSWMGQAEAHLGGRVDGKELRTLGSDDLGFVVGFERGWVEIEGERRDVDIRATSMFRKEQGRWTMIGHHTDPLG